MTAAIEQVYRQRERERQAKYHGLITALACGEDVGVDDTIDLLDAAGKSPEQLSADVSRLQWRLSLAALRDSMPDVRRRLAGVDAAVAAEVERFERQRLEHLERLGPLQDERRQVVADGDAAASAAGELARSCPKALRNSIKTKIEIASRYRSDAAKERSRKGGDEARALQLEAFADAASEEATRLSGLTNDPHTWLPWEDGIDE